MLTSTPRIDPITTDKPAIIAYPNPIAGRTVNLQMVNQKAGNYTIALINSLGQVVYQTQIQHSGGSLSKSLQLSKPLTGGIYQLRVTNGESITNLKVLSNN